MPAEDRHPWLSPIVGGVLAAAGSLVCLSSAGPFQGMLFGACIVVVLLTPTLIAGTQLRLLWPLLTVLGIAVGALVAPAAALSRGELNTRIFLAAAAVIPALTLAAAGLTLLLARFRITPVIAAWLVTFLLLAWLAWPIWMSPWIAEHQAWLPALTSPHPLLALDAALMRDGVKQWIEAPSLMYGPPALTSLGQDVFYVPPATVWVMVGVHLAVAVPGFVLAGWVGKRKTGSRQFE